ncbi:DUF6308 family protein [Streptomyces wuyuanensis]|uniref:DUF6308 family protein n=1 Tax=Streptomyces wuyuanensis TaxID=1196353 RepID=UPI003711777D
MTLNIPPDLWNQRYVATLLQRYWAVLPDGTPAYTGSRFERLGAGGDRPDVANCFTAEDFVAVAALSVDVPVRAVLQILEPTRPHHYNGLLSEIPAETALVDAEAKHVAEDSPAWRLWTRLREIDGVGPIGAGKLLARKRPHLLPVYDSVIKKVFERPTTDLGFWSDVRSALRHDNRALVQHLEAVRDLAEIGKDVSVLRILDTAAWLHGQGPEV